MNVIKDLLHTLICEQRREHTYGINESIREGKKSCRTSANSFLESQRVHAESSLISYEEFYFSVSPLPRRMHIDYLTLCYEIILNICDI